MAKALKVLIGNDVLFSVAFTDEAGAAFDPSVVTFTIRPETGDDIVYTYLDGDEIVRDGVGEYHIWIARDVEGEYTGFFAGTGTMRARGCEKVEMVAECA